MTHIIHLAFLNREDGLSNFVSIMFISCIKFMPCQFSLDPPVFQTPKEMKLFRGVDEGFVKKLFIIKFYDYQSS